MEPMETVAEVPEVNTQDKMAQPDAGLQGFSGKPGDFAADMAKIAAEFGHAPEAPAPIAAEAPAAIQHKAPEAAPAQPEQPQAAGQPTVEVPKKFQNADGTVDADKVQKSEVNLDEAIARYKAKEREFQQLQNKVNNPPAYQPPVAQAQEGIDPFVAQLNADLAANPSNPGLVLAKLFHAAKDSAYQQAKQDIEGIRTETHAEKNEKELAGLLKLYPEMASPDGIEKLSAIRQERGINTWRGAFREYIADQGMTQRLGGQVQTPNPTAAAVKAPASPAAAAPRAVAEAPKTEKEINAMLNGMTQAQQNEFWKRTFPGLKRI